MRTLAKFLLGIIGLVLAIGLAVIVAVVLLVDPDDYRGLIADTVERETGRSLAIEGSLGLSKFPCCSITLGRTVLGNPAGFPSADFASIDAAALELRVWPLLTRREVIIGRIMLDGLDMNLVRRADGAANWDFSDAQAVVAEPAPRAPEGGGDLALSSIAGIDVRRARLVYTDTTSGADWLVENLDLQTGAISADTPFDMRGSLDFSDRAGGSGGSLQLRALALLDVAAAQATLQELKAQLALAGPALPARHVALELGAAGLRLDAAGEASRLELEALALELKLEELPDLAGRVHASLRAPALSAELGDSLRATLPALSGTFELSEPAAVAQKLSGRFDSETVVLQTAGETSRLTAAALATTLHAVGRELPGGKADIVAALEQLDLDTATLAGRVGKLTASLSGPALNATLSGQGRFGDQRADAAGTFSIEPFSPRELLAALGQAVPVTADPAVLGSLGGTAGWFLRPGAQGLREMDLRLDDTRIRGTVEQGREANPLTRFDLDLDRIDLDRYLAPDPPPPPRGQPRAPAPPEELPLEAIRALRLDGRARIGALKLSGAELSGVEATVAADRGVLRLEPLRATLYGGRYEGRLTLDATGPQARLALVQELAGVQAGPLLGDLFELGQVAGLLTSRLEGSATGRTDQELIRNLQGTMALKLTDGYFEGMDLWYEIRRARSVIRRQVPEPRSGPNRTPIEALDISGQIAEGVLRSDQLVMRIPSVQLSGRGGLDLLARSLDYSLQARVSGAPRSPAGEDLADLRNVTIPLTIKGDLDAPRVGVDMAGLVREAAGEAVLDRVLERIGGRERPADTEPAPPPEAGEPLAPQAEEERKESSRDARRRLLRELIDP